MLNGDDVVWFLEVARTGSLTEAGKNLGVEHTTVGRRMNRLERVLGARLFDRTPGGWTTTPAGRTLMPHAVAMEATLQAIEREMTSETDEPNGSVRIVAPDGFGSFVLFPGLGEFQRSHSSLLLEMVTTTRSDVTRDGEYDLAITVERERWHAMTTSELARYEFRLYAAPSYLRQAPALEYPSQLSAHPTIGYLDALLDVDALRILDDLCPGHRAAIQTTNIGGQVEAAVAGLGVALLPSYIATIRGGLVEALPGFGVPRSYWLTMPTAMVRVPRIRAAVAAIRTLVGRYPGLAPA